MVKNERGSEVVQFMFAIFALMTLLFGALYVACYTATASILSSELSQACLRLDTAALAASPDKARFIATELAGESSQLDYDSIQVSDISVNASQQSGFHSETSINQRAKVSSISFSVSYRLPVALSITNDQQGRLERHVVCSIEDERISEVSVA